MIGYLILYEIASTGYEMLIIVELLYFVKLITLYSVLSSNLILLFYSR